MIYLQDILSLIGIKFEPKKHQYFIKDREIPSANKIIDKVMGNVFTKDTLYMRQARDKGTLIHNAINKFIIAGEQPDFAMIEFDNFIKLSNKHKLIWDMSEQIIYNNIDGMEYAGTLDLYCQEKAELSDIKTGSTKQIKKWQIQLSLYAWSLIDKFGLKVERLSILWLHDDKAEYIELKLLSKQEITDILRKYYADDINNQNENISLKCLDNKAIQEFGETLTAIEIMEQKVKEIKEKIKIEMEQRNINQIKIGKRVISYVAPTIRESIDNKKLKAEYPEVWDMCKKVSNVASSIRIK